MHTLELPALATPRAATLRLRLTGATAEEHVRLEEQQLFCPTDQRLALGTRVMVDVAIQLGPRIFIEGEVCWRRHREVFHHLRAGVGVQIDPAHRCRLVYLDTWFKEGTRLDRRQGTRFPLMLPIHYWIGSTQHFNFTRDASLSGLFICARRLVELRAPLKLLLVAGGTIGQLQLTGRVVRHERRSRLRYGMGIQLELPEGEIAERYRALVEQTRHGFAVASRMRQRIG